MSWLRDLLERHTWRPLWKQRQTGRRQRLSDPGHHRGEMVTGHGFMPVEWMAGCGYLAHPQADRCGRPRLHHKGRK